MAESSGDAVTPGPIVATSETANTAAMSSSRHLSAPQAFPMALASLLSVLVVVFCSLHASFSSLHSPSTYFPSRSRPFNLTNALDHITRLGQKQRFVSSFALEDSLQYIHSFAESLHPIAHQNNLHLDVEFFRSSPGSFSTELAKVHLLHSYDNLSSVIARVRPKHLPADTDEPALLINAHVDSAVGTPGVSDNLSGVGLVMEILRLVVSYPSAFNPRRPIIFLFNGAEEVVLHGAHSFVTQHPWGRTPAAHINLESMGSGNRYFLFRVGPNPGWLARVYAKAVSVPFAAVMGTDIYNTKLIPADTDFRVFDEVAGIPGYDLALINNGYVYHTLYDDLRNLDPQGVLHGGITVFELAVELAGSNDAIGTHLAKSSNLTIVEKIAIHLSSVFSFLPKPSGSQVVFFDVFHLFTVVYSDYFALLLNLSVLFVTAALWVSKLWQWSWQDRFMCLRMCVVFIASIFGGFMSACFSSFVYADLLKMKIVWYGSNGKALFVYAPPTLFGFLTAMFFLLPKNLSVNRFEQMLFAVTMFHTCLAVLLTHSNVMSAFVPICLIMVSNICLIQKNRVSAFGKHVQLAIASSVYLAVAMWSTMCAILPLLGRIRSAIVPHDTIAAGIVTYCCLMGGLIISAPILTHYAAGLRRTIRVCAAFCIFIGLFFSILERGVVTFGGEKFEPYSTRAPKRISFNHFHSANMSPESVIMFSEQDPREANLGRIMGPLFEWDEGLQSLTRIPKFGSMDVSPSEAFLCFKPLIHNSMAVKTGRKPQLAPSSLRMETSERQQRGWHMSFVGHGPDSHVMSVRIGIAEDLRIVEWSFNADVPKDEDRDAWIRHDGSSEVRFWLLVARKDGENEVRPSITIVIGSARLGKSRSPDLMRLTFEKWEAPAFMVSTASEFTF